MQYLQYSSNELRKSSKIGCQLIRIHASEGRLQEAANVFNSLYEKNVYAWTAVISAYVQHNCRDEAILLYNRMQKEGVKPNSYTLVAVMKACVGHCDMNVGKLLHYEIVDQDCKCDNFIENALMYMYASHGCVEDAWYLFSALPSHDSISWASLIGGYSKHGHDQIALQYFMKMLQSGAKPNEFSLICILKSCTAINRLHEGRLVHNCVLKEGFNNDKFINCSLLNLYSKCGSIEDAYKVFEGLKHRNVVAWSSMILGYTEHGLATEGIDLFNQMHFQGVVPNEITFVCVLKACWHLSAVEVGRDVYSYLLKLGLHLDVLVGSSLIDVYAACGKVDDARKVFDSLLEKNVVCWSAIISCHEEHGNYEEALLLYHNMQSEGAHADGFLFVIILNVCTNLRALNQGRIIHSEATKAGLASDLFVGSNLIDMYAKCGQVNDSFAVFDNLSVRDVVAWSALIEGLTMNEHEHEALRVFCDMINNRIMPNEVTFLSVLKASASMRDIRVGNAIFMYAIELGFHSVCAIGNTLVDLYAKGGSLEDAQVFFNKLSVQDLVSWNALIGGYVEKGHSFEAFLLVEKLQNKGFVGVDESTIWSMLKVCSCMAASHRGRLIHSAIVKYGLEKEMIIHNSLINMYTKCGFMLDALSIFDKSPVRTAVTWNALISGFAEHGHIMAAEWCFVNMQSDEISADEVTFVSLLSGCNHAGLIGEGFHLFHLMGTECYLTPTIQHFICLIDILGRAGCFYEAEDLIAKMPFEPDCVVWMSLLSSYEKHGWSQQAGQLFDVFLESSRTSAAAYVLMSNISVAN